ncbi:MAG TPA: Zn-dependent hydrolase [Steroidobacteraceae bacterium]
MDARFPSDDLSIDEAWLLGSLEELARINRQPDGSCRRVALTDADRSGRDLLVAWMHELDLEVRVDQIGNILGIFPGQDAAKPIMIGSHIDTVSTGGRLDGAYGVIAGLELIRTLKRHGITPRRPLVVASFTNEEGVRFQPDMMGSLVYAGGLDLQAALRSEDRDGTVLGDELKRIGYAGECRCGALVPAAYIELHIEQGPILSREGIPLGAVENLQGISWQQVTIHGQANHAGTTPMSSRKDAAQAAAKVMSFAQELALHMGGQQLATVGSVHLDPGLINVVPRKAILTVDLRNPLEAHLQEAESRLVDFLEALSVKDGVLIEKKQLARLSPVTFDPEIVRTIEMSAGTLGKRIRRMTSGAGHDAQMMARISPAAMIFVPSVEGVSHNPAEHTEPEHLALGANVLLRTVLALSERA